MSKQLIENVGKIPLLGPWFQKKLVYRMAESKAREFAKHFTHYLQPEFSLDIQNIHASQRIRHDVYCEELGFEPLRSNQLESDEFDPYSKHCLIKHLNSDLFAGSVRMVTTDGSPNNMLPIEKYCTHALDNSNKHPNQYVDEGVCEISRLAIRPQFRRRKADRFAGAATGVINKDEFSEDELRCFPFIAMGLYMSAAALAVAHKIPHVFVMMEPRLARSMRLLGIEFEQIGPAVDYHGKRAPYYITTKAFRSNLPPNYRLLYQSIEKKINSDSKQVDLGSAATLAKVS